MPLLYCPDLVIQDRCHEVGVAPTPLLPPGQALVEFSATLQGPALSQKLDESKLLEQKLPGIGQLFPRAAVVAQR